MKDTIRNFPALIVDDDPTILEYFAGLFKSLGMPEVILCDDPRKVAELIDSKVISVMILDLMMPGVSGEELLQKICESHPEIPIIVSTGQQDLDIAIRCMKLGAFDFVQKNPDPSRFLASVEHALKIRELQSEYSRLKNTMLEGNRPPSKAFERIVTADPIMLNIFKYIETVAGSAVKPILITGESGTGKELVAEAIHKCSGRKGKMVSLNIAGLDDSVFSDTLFGHKKGAFTSADADRQGLIDHAAGGTLFLDEIGDLKPSSQVKLLRLIEERRYYPLGADNPRAADVLLITATNQDLTEASKKKRFRLDLFYRLETHYIRIPPLRERMDDIPLLVESFLMNACKLTGRGVPQVPKEVFSLLKSYSFPGNVRELESMVHDALTRCTGKRLSLEPFKLKIYKDDSTYQKVPNSKEEGNFFASMDRLPTLKEAENLLIVAAMDRSGRNQGIAASMLGITRTALNKRLKAKKEQVH